MFSVCIEVACPDDYLRCNILKSKMNFGHPVIRYEWDIMETGAVYCGNSISIANCYCIILGYVTIGYISPKTLFTEIGNARDVLGFYFGFFIWLCGLKRRHHLST